MTGFLGSVSNERPCEGGFFLLLVVGSKSKSCLKSCWIQCMMYLSHIKISKMWYSGSPETVQDWTSWSASWRSNAWISKIYKLYITWHTTAQQRTSLNWKSAIHIGSSVYLFDYMFWLQQIWNNILKNWVTRQHFSVFRTGIALHLSRSANLCKA